MGRLGILAGIAAALVVAAVALGAAGDVRIHRLHLPPPPADALGSEGPPAGGTTDPTAPGTTSPPAPPAPPGTQPPAPPPPPPSAVGCTTGGGATPSATGTLADYTLTLDATTFSSAGPLTFRGINTGLDFHTIAIKRPGAAGALLCGTATITNGNSDSFTVTNLTPGSYTIYCTVHPLVMHEDITVN